MSISLTIPYRRFEYFGGELSVEIAETLSRIIGIAVEVCVKVIATDLRDRDDPENGSLDFTIRVSCPDINCETQAIFVDMPYYEVPDSPPYSKVISVYNISDGMLHEALVIASAICIAKKCSNVISDVALYWVDREFASAEYYERKFQYDEPLTTPSQSGALTVFERKRNSSASS